MPRTPNSLPGDDIVVRVRDLTSAQKAHIDLCMECTEDSDVRLVREGASFIEATVANLKHILEDLEFRKGDDHVMNVAGGANKDLSDHQVKMAVDNILKGLDNTIKKITNAMAKEASDAGHLKAAMEESGKAIKAAISNKAGTIEISAEGGTVNADGSLTVPKVTPLPELDEFFKPDPEDTPEVHRERMVRYDVLKTFDLAFFATKDHASAFDQWVRKQGDTYRLKGLEHMPCGREKHLDVPRLDLFAVSCKGR